MSSSFFEYYNIINTKILQETRRIFKRVSEPFYIQKTIPGLHSTQIHNIDLEIKGGIRRINI